MTTCEFNFSSYVNLHKSVISALKQGPGENVGDTTNDITEWLYFLVLFIYFY